MHNKGLSSAVKARPRRATDKLINISNSATVPFSSFSPTARYSSYKKRQASPRCAKELSALWQSRWRRQPICFTLYFNETVESFINTVYLKQSNNVVPVFLISMHYCNASPGKWIIDFRVKFSINKYLMKYCQYYV